MPGAVGAIEDAVGQEAKVALYPGRPILESQLGAPALVERNAVVRMSYAGGPLRIVTEGRALDRAAAGEPVRVMNLASRQTVTGTVAPDGSIEVERRPHETAPLPRRPARARRLRHPGRSASRPR